MATGAVAAPPARCRSGRDRRSCECALEARGAACCRSGRDRRSFECALEEIGAELVTCACGEGEHHALRDRATTKSRQACDAEEPTILRRVDPAQQGAPALAGGCADGTRRADHGADGTTALAPGVPREAECYRCRAIAVSIHETARTNDNHGSTRTAAIAPQPEHGLLGRSRRGDRPTHLPLDETVTDEHQRAAHGARGCSAAGAAPWPRLGARGHLRAPGLDSQRACDKPVGASWMFDC
jgi:hypothetical protein